jgi:hypothetical protein
MTTAGSTLAVVGYRDFLRALAAADRRTKRQAREVLRKAGDAVKGDASGRMMPKDGKTAAGYRTVVRQRGVAVEQSIRKTTGQHPEWGSYQMRHALLPALQANEQETVAAMERALDEIAALFNAGGPIGEVI